MTSVETRQRTDEVEVLARIRRYAELDRQAITPDDEARLRRYGIYTQRPATDGYFMVRLRMPGGDLTAEQLGEIAALANTHGRGLADITVRQNIQFHWVRIESLPDILERLRRIGLSTTEACGDSVRNIMNCPVSGVDRHELYDATPLIQQVNDFFIDNRDFSNLPRKFKIAITGCAVRCVYPEINDIGLFAVREAGRVAFRARVGGGLSTSPRFSKDLGVLAEPEEVAELCAAVAAVFRDAGTSRKRERLRFLVEPGEIPRFREAVEERLGRRLRRAEQAEAEPITAPDRTHLGIQRQAQSGLSYVGISLLGGRTSGDELARLAELAATCGSGRLRATNTQNIILLDIKDTKLPALTGELDKMNLDYKPSWARRGIIACTGTQFCKLALTETKNRAAELDTHLSRAVDLEDGPRISVTGCPNSCGQHHICDVGLEGALVTINGRKRETFQVFLGGGVGLHESIGRRIGVRIPSEELPERMAQLFTRYKQERRSGETFQAFCLRHSNEELSAMLAPVLPPAAEASSQFLAS